MDPVNQYQFYQIGWIIHQLSDLTIQSDLGGPNYWKLQTAKHWLEFILKDKPIPLVTSKASVVTLLNAVNAIMPKAQQALAGRPLDASASPISASLLGKVTADVVSDKMDFMEAYNLKHGVETFETVLAAELQTMATYFVSRKLGYETRLLLSPA